MAEAILGSKHNPNKRKSPPEDDDDDNYLTTTKQQICMTCHEYDLKCHYRPGESRCERCTFRKEHCVPYYSSYGAGGAARQKNHHHSQNANTAAAAPSYNHWVAAAASNNATRFSAQPQPQQSPPPFGIQPQPPPPPYGRMTPEQFQQLILMNPAAAQHAAAAAAAYAYHQHHPTTTTTTAPTPPKNTHPSFNFFKQQHRHSPQQHQHHHHAHQQHQQQHQQLLHINHPYNHMSQALTAARAMNDGAAHIARMMERRIDTTTTNGNNNGGGGYDRLIGGSPGYINHTVYTRNGHVPTSSRRRLEQQPQQQQHYEQQQQQHYDQQQQPQSHLTTPMKTTTTTNHLDLYSSIIPCPSGPGKVKQIDSKSVLDNVSRRVRNECMVLCLLPTEDFEPYSSSTITINNKSSSSSSSSINNNTNGNTKRGKRSANEWLRCAVSLVFSSLNLESPNPVGWDDVVVGDHSMEWDDEEEQQQRNGGGGGGGGSRSRGGGGSPKDAYWFNGIYHKLSGPQPWQCTRPFIIQTIYQLLLAEGYATWLISESRWKALECMIRPIIAINLILWKPSIFNNKEEGESEIVTEYSQQIWRQYREDHLRTIRECEKALVPPQIGFEYVCHVANSLGWSSTILRTTGNTNTNNNNKGSTVGLGGGGRNNNNNNHHNMASTITTTKTSVEVSPDPNIPLCIPIGEGGTNGSGNMFAWESKWTCDVCSACFRVYDEAVAHEIECKKKKSSQAASTGGGETLANGDDDDDDVIQTTKQPTSESTTITTQNNNDDGGGGVVECNVEYAVEEEWKCDFCPLSFATYEEAAAHETECHAATECKTKSPQAAAEEAAKEDDEKNETTQSSSETTKQGDDDDVAECNVGYAMEEKWKCDFCPASFSVFDEAAAHEAECRSKSQAAEAEAAKDDEENKTTQSSEMKQGDDGVVVEHVLNEAAAHETECKAKSQAAAEAAKDIENKTTQSSSETKQGGDGVVEGSAGYDVEEKWKCDFCPASFSVFDEAAAHEAECKEKSQAAAEVANDEENKTTQSSKTKQGDDDVAECSVGYDVEEKWKCDFCPASFSVFDEAAAHEAECKEKSQAAAEVANDEENKTTQSSKTKQGDDDVAECSVGYDVEEKWKCDFCSASFSVYDEAVAHETECKTKSQSVEVADKEDEVELSSRANDENMEGYTAEHRWKCDYCSASFSVYDEAVAHENVCKDESQEEGDVVEVNITNFEANQRSGEGVEGYIVEEKWKCDYCSASFLLYDQAVSHERECKAKSQSAAVDDATTGEENQTSDEGGEKRKGYVLEKQWKCDYCDARFHYFDEATAHETECKRKTEAETLLSARSSVSNRDAAASPQHIRVLDAEIGMDFVVSKEIRSSLLKTVKRLHYEYFPLMSGGDEKLVEVCEEVLRCMHAITPITKENEVTSKKRVECVLNHLEHSSGYLSTLNGIFRVRVNKTALMDDDSRSESPAEITRQMSSESEDPEAIVVTYGLDSNGDQVIMAATSPERASQGGAKSIMPQPIETLTPCGECILCNAPDCERCFACLSKGRTDTEICIRKSCCKIPFEYKAKSLVGFPSKWQYAFCDPNQGVLVKSPRRILSLAGLVIRRPLPLAQYQIPMYQYFHSFEAAFSAVQHEDTSEATNLVESFLSHIHGSDGMRSYPNHFLVGRRFCFEFTSVDGMNVAMFGVISTCFRESSEAENDIFMVQYDSDCIEIAAKSLGTNVLRLQLISSQRAWGGCISFERKACIRGPRSVVRSIDQATAVEYWVTPDMRMEELVEQDNGIKVPQLTILLRGYKFVFSAHNDHEGTGVSVSCISMNVDDGNDDESILKPGELIDLGVFCPLLDSDTKPLAVFILKNYLHNFTINSYAGDGNGNVYDLTDDARGSMHLTAIKKVLSYVRSCKETEIPTLHGGLDPSGKVHLLFGVRYHGDWKEYTSNMEEEIQPIFRGEQKEVTLAPNLMTNEDQEARYLSAIKNFGPEELVQCAKFFGTLFLGISAGVTSSEMKERSLRVATCLRHRIAELGDISSMEHADQLIRRAIDRVKVSQHTPTDRLSMPLTATEF